MGGYTQAALDLVQVAQLEAKRLGYPFVQREQLFLGLLHDHRVGRILASLEIDLQSVRDNVEQGLLPGLGAPDDISAIGLLPTAEQVYRHRAQTAATIMGHTHVGTEHILLGFLLEQHGVVLEVLTARGVTKEMVMDAMGRLES